MTTSDLIQYYQNLLAVQYRNLPNARGTVAAVVTPVVADQIYSQVLNGFNIDTAVGAQLDILAQYVGAPRTIFAFDPLIPFFALTDYADTPASNVGFADYSDTTPPVDNWLAYDTAPTSYTLTDGQLRLLIKYLVAVHASDHTLASIDLILQTFFGIYCTMTDNGDMTITYTHQSSDPNQLFKIVNELNLLPRPAGVQVIVVQV